MADERLIEAAGWAERLDSGCDPADRARFARWQGEPANAAAWDAVAQARGTVLDIADDDALAAMHSAALERIGAARAPRRRALWQYAAAACLAALVPATLWQVARHSQGPADQPWQAYRTADGQRLQATLADGSRLTLNAGSEVRVRYTAGERRLVIDRGQAQFDVAKNAQRPFRVVAGSETVTAHGTSFDVRRDGAAVQVALIEGKVSVASTAPQRREIYLRPDDILTASSAGMTVRHVPGSAEAFASWRIGRLVFVNDTLGAAVAEMNRYSTTRITVADVEVGALRISGSFRIGDVAPFLEALQLGFPVTVAHRADGSVAIASQRPRKGQGSVSGIVSAKKLN